MIPEHPLKSVVYSTSSSVLGIFELKRFDEHTMDWDEVEPCIGFWVIENDVSTYWYWPLVNNGDWMKEENHD